MAVPTVRSIFLKCQDSAIEHDNLSKHMATILKKSDFLEFWETFLNHLKYSFEYISTREPAVENIVNFAIKFVTQVVKQDLDTNENKENEGDNTGENEDVLRGSKLLSKLLKFCLKYHNYEDSVRFRCCQIITKLLANLGEDAELDEYLYDRISEVLVERLRDVLPVVRIQAVYASSRFQDPKDDECPIIQAFIDMLYDPKPDVRKAVLTTIVPCRKTLPEIIKRTRDVNDAVRKQAYEIVADKIHIKALTIHDRIELLKNGLNDRVESVKATCSTKLLQAWLGTYAGNVLDLLRSLDVETSVDVCKQALLTMFKATPVTVLVEGFDLLNDNKLIDIESLTAAKAFYWFNLCEYLHSELPVTDEQFEALMPDCMQFCDYVMKYMAIMKKTYETAQTNTQTDTDEDTLILEMQQTFVCEQFLRLTSLFEHSDLAVSDRMRKLYHEMLNVEYIDYTLIEHIIPRVMRLHADKTTLIVYVAETISNIREPISFVSETLDENDARQIKLKMAAIRVEINETREDMETAVLKQDFMDAENLKKKLEELETRRDEMNESLVPKTQEVRTEKDDACTILKCLCIVKELLICIDITAIDPTLRTIAETLVLPNILRSEVKVRDVSIYCLGLLCLISKDFALQYLVLLIQVTQVDHDRIRATGLKVIFDILHVYGMAILESDETDKDTTDKGDENSDENNDETKKGDAQNTTANIVAILVSMMDSECCEIRTVAAEGLAKLMLSSRLDSATLFSRLLLLWYNPTSEEDLHLRQCLAQFFPLYAVAGKENQEVIGEAYIMSLKTLFDAPSSSPLSAVDINDVSNVLIGLTSARMLAEKHNKRVDDMTDHTIHNELAISLCNQVLSCPDSMNVLVMANALKSLDLNPDNSLHIKDIHTLIDKIVEVVKDKKSLVVLKKFHSNVSYLLNSQSEPENSIVTDETQAENTQISDDATNDKNDDEVFTENNPADLYRTMLEEMNKSGSLNRSSTKSDNSVSNTSTDQADKEADNTAVSNLQTQLSQSLSIDNTDNIET